MKKINLLFLALALWGCENNSPSVSTLAGSGEYGWTDGPALQATFDRVKALATDSMGNIYVSDYNNHKPKDRISYNHLIRKISPEGIVSTVAGGQKGYADGVGTEAKFNGVIGMVCDPKGNLLVTDYYNNRIRRISPDGKVETIAGNGRQISVDGPALEASFNNPGSLTLDAQGNLYIVDSSSRTIRKLSASGQVTTLAGSGLTGAEDGPGSTASFSDLRGIAVDANGQVYVADFRTHLIRKISPDGVVSTLAGTGYGFGDGKGIRAAFNKPSGLAVDGLGNLIVGDMANNRIRLISPDGTVTTLAGADDYGDTDGSVASATLNNPTAVALGLGGTILFLDYNSNKVRMLTPGK